MIALESQRFSLLGTHVLKRYNLPRKHTWKTQKRPAPTPSLDASPILRQALLIGKPRSKRVAFSAFAGYGRTLRSMKVVTDPTLSLGDSHQEAPDRRTGDLQGTACCNGQSRPPERLPYRLEASPSPANRDYVGASSSWFGANRNAIVTSRRCCNLRAKRETALFWLFSQTGHPLQPGKEICRLGSPLFCIHGNKAYCKSQEEWINSRCAPANLGFDPFNLGTLYLRGSFAPLPWLTPRICLAVAQAKRSFVQP